MIITDLIKSLIKYLDYVTNKETDSSEKKARIFSAIESIEDGSNKITSWSLSIVGGSFLAIMNEKFIRPDNDLFKYVYSLFGIGWFLIGISIFFNKKISNSKMAAVLNREKIDLLKIALNNINGYYAKQLKFFNLSLFVFGLWLLTYLIWWIFGERIECLIKCIIN